MATGIGNRLYLFYQLKTTLSIFVIVYLLSYVLKALKPFITVYKCLLFYIVLGTGQMAGVELDSVSGGLSEPELGEIRGISAQHFIRFDEQNPETTTDKTLVIKNTT